MSLEPGGLRDLLARWRRDADVLALYGVDHLARLCKQHAAEIEAALRAKGDESLSLAEAARESGYSTDHLRHLVAAGTIPNVGRRHRPQVRRADLPRKSPRPSGGYNPEADARRLLVKFAGHDGAERQESE